MPIWSIPLEQGPATLNTRGGVGWGESRFVSWANNILLLQLSSFSSQELKNKKQLYENRIEGIVSGRQQEYEAKLMNTLQELRKEHEQQIKEYKDQVEQNFQAKVSKMGRILRENVVQSTQSHVFP